MAHLDHDAAMKHFAELGEWPSDAAPGGRLIVEPGSQDR